MISIEDKLLPKNNSKFSNRSLVVLKSCFLENAPNFIKISVVPSWGIIRIKFSCCHLRKRLVEWSV